MPSVGLEPTIPAFERAKTVHALDRTATVIGKEMLRKGISVINFTHYNNLEMLCLRSNDINHISEEVLISLDKLK
jgi:hypothetical protein